MAKSYWKLEDGPTPIKPTPPGIVRIREDEVKAREESFPSRKQLPKCCSKSYKTYKALMPPKCCGGEGCQVCWLIYEDKNGIK